MAYGLPANDLPFSRERRSRSFQSGRLRPRRSSVAAACWTAPEIQIGFYAVTSTASHRASVLIGLLSDRRHACVDGPDKLDREFGGLIVVPAVGLGDIEVRLRCEAKPLHLRRTSLARTSAHDLAAEG